MDKIKEIKLKEFIDSDKLVNLLDSKGVKIDRNLLQNKFISESLTNQLILRYLPEFLESPKGEPELFYGKYYWMTAFNTKYKKLFGDDESLDQQLFKLCEEAEQENLDVDWQTVESIEREAVMSIN
jgi:hypothetical protein